VIQEAMAMGTSGGGQPAGGTDTLLAFLPLILMFGILYFLLIRPQQKRQREHKQMMEALKKDDQVITSGGIHGIIVSVGDKDDTLTLKIAQNVNIIVNRSAVARKK
jgi:preprotein translocase subunit YajC